MSQPVTPDPVSSQSEASKEQVESGGGGATGNQPSGSAADQRAGEAAPSEPGAADNPAGLHQVDDRGPAAAPDADEGDGTTVRSVLDHAAQYVLDHDWLGHIDYPEAAPAAA
ncbi:MAG: hypothetical protein LBM66_05665, partial [Bifidobacteriaceae bacterium]|nr:hypothetical protein [Bifidobacteriaceae bacterium]